MARDFQINGEVLVRVRGNAIIGTTFQDLGLCSDSVSITPNFKQMDIAVDAWGGSEGPPPEIQWMLADVDISLTLVHYDDTVLNNCIRQSMGGRAIGRVARAGTRMGGGFAVGVAGNQFMNLLLTAPIPTADRVWYFPATYLTGPPEVYPIGVQRSLVQLKFRAIPFPSNALADPAGTVTLTGTGAGNTTGAGGVVLWSNTTPA